MMDERSVVMPAVRIPRELWLYLEEIMRRKMFSSKAELVKDALREYVSHNRELLHDFEILSAAVKLKRGRFEDEERERRLLEWLRELRSKHQCSPSPPLRSQ
ncbi:hypothetical protein KEJ49_00875 [Candidatus Bathyarchaeota archaeon]|nr:hypothetical protein [Candidatus Bathyarchaeota archaeon]